MNKLILLSAFSKLIEAVAIIKKGVATNSVDMQPEFDTFISHSSEDKGIAETVLKGLEENGIRCWIAPRDVPIGDKWSGAITRGIGASKVFILILTDKSNQSDAVHKEVTLASDFKKPILCYKTINRRLSDDLNYFLRSIQWVEAVDQYPDKTVPVLVDAVQKLLSHLQPVVSVSDLDIPTVNKKQPTFPVAKPLKMQKLVGLSGKLEGKFSNSILIFTALILAIVVIFAVSYDFFSKRRVETKIPSNTDSASIMTFDTNMNTTSVNSARSDEAGELDSIVRRILPSGIELNIPVFGMENKLLVFIKSDRAVDKETWFDFDRLPFETGNATLKPESQEQLKNIAEILKAYPNVNVKIGGFTDNTGNANANLKLSQDRTNSVRFELEKMSIARNRLEIEGYGEEHPIVSNDTEAGRVKNRRISIRVQKK